MVGRHTWCPGKTLPHVTPLKFKTNHSAHVGDTAVTAALKRQEDRVLGQQVLTYLKKTTSKTRQHTNSGAGVTGTSMNDYKIE